MYVNSAPWYDLLYAFKDYEQAARRVHDTIAQIFPSARRLLDVACGTGRHLEVLRRWYEVEGLDLSDDLLSIARRRLPDVPLHRADMTSFQLPTRFDVIVCLFSSIAYVRTVENLSRTIERFAEHLAPGGVLIVEPFFSPEQYWTDRVTLNTVDRPEVKIAWMYTSDPPVDDIATLRIHYLVGTPRGVEHFTERHELGLFQEADYIRAFRDTGLDVRFDTTGFFGRGAYIATSPIAP